MRLLIDQGKITSQYRPSENAPWKDVGRGDIPAEGSPRVGVMSGGAPQEAERYARFRGFRIVELPRDK